MRRRGSYGCRRLCPYHRGVAAVLDFAWPAEGMPWTTRRRSANCLRCRHVLVARSYDGVRVACIPDRGRRSGALARVHLGARRSDNSRLRRACVSGEAGCRPAVSGASVSARFPSRSSGRCSGRLRRDMKKAATVFRWRPLTGDPRQCGVYAFLSAGVRSRRSRARRRRRRHPSSGTPCRCARCGARSRPADR